jgi:hypothetical protein
LIIFFPRMENKASPGSTAVNTPRINSHKIAPTEFLFIVGGNVNHSLNFLGVVAETQPTLLGYTTFPHVPSYPLPPLAKSIVELAFESPITEIIKLEAIHAVNRHLVAEEPIGGKYFVFTVHPKSVVEDTLNDSSIFFCYCFDTFEILPLPPPWDGYAGVVPTVYCLVTRSNAFEDCKSVLNEIANQRKIYMKKFWAGKFGNRYTFRSELQFDLISSNDQLINSIVPTLVSAAPAPVILGLIAAAITDKRIIISSRSRARRATFVLGLYVLMELVCGVKYPHPCLGIVPSSIASELVHAPTPLIAAVNRFERKRNKNPDCVFLNLDKISEHTDLVRLGSEVFPETRVSPTELGDSQSEPSISKISNRIIKAISVFESTIFTLTRECVDFPSALSVVTAQNSSQLILLFNSSSLQLYLSEKGGSAVWLNHSI